MNALFFSRGRGRGHAIPDVAIARDLWDAEPAVRLGLASYGTGAKTIRDCGYNVIDLGLPDENPFLITLFSCLRVISKTRPDIVISHEEFSAVPAAKSLGIPALFLIDWFPLNVPVWMECLTAADQILFLDDNGIYDEPASLKGKITYTGPVVRELGRCDGDQKAARAELHLPSDAAVILVSPGGAAQSSESNSPIFDIVLDAVRLLAGDPVILWVSPVIEHESLIARVCGRASVIFMEPHTNIERTMVAADIAITKGTRRTSFELNALGIPSISISYGLNPIDDYRVAQIPTNCALRARGLTAESLSRHMVNALRRGTCHCIVPGDAAAGRRAAVERILPYMRKYRQASGGNEKTAVAE